MSYRQCPHGLDSLYCPACKRIVDEAQPFLRSICSGGDPLPEPAGTPTMAEAVEVIEALLHPSADRHHADDWKKAREFLARVKAGHG